MSSRDDVKKLIIEHNRRLQVLKQQQARQGLETPPSVMLEIEDIQARLEELQVELETLQAAADDSPPQIQTATYSPPSGPSSGEPTRRIFLCHTTEDKPKVQKLYRQLKEAGYHPWLDKYDLLPGQDWWSEIEKIVGDPDNLVVACLSLKSIDKRGVVQKEIKSALDVLDQMPEDIIYLIPARLEPCQVPRRLSKLHWVDLFEPDGFEYLTRALDFEISHRWLEPQPKPKQEQKKPTTISPPKKKSAALVRRPKTKKPTITSPPQPKPTTHTPQPIEPEMILIPAGEFLMGSDPSVDKEAQAREQPQHRLYLPDYYMAKTPVTNAQYAAFVQATGHEQPSHFEGEQPPAGKLDHPVVNVSWHDAVAYCNWLAKATGKPYRLPTEAEWEKGARGSDGRIYPWGNQWDKKRCNTYEGGKRDTTPVVVYPNGASPYGLLDMAGNVWEWTKSLWGKKHVSPEPVFKYPYDPTDGRENMEAGDEFRRVLRGGSLNVDPDQSRCAYRDWYLPDFRNNYYGFRCVVLLVE